MCIFPKFYTYNTEDPEDYAFAGNETDGFDFTHFNPKFWAKLEKRISQLDELGIQADVILLHPYDKWGFSKMDKETDILYLKYAVDRLSHYKNVWWSLANEFDLLPWKSVEDWETYARVVMRRDPYGHLRSIHNCVKLYDHIIHHIEEHGGNHRERHRHKATLCISAYKVNFVWHDNHPFINK